MRYRLRTLLNWLFRKPIGFFEKANSRASLRSVLAFSAVAAVVAAVAFFLVNPHPSRQGYCLWLPLWVLANAAIGGLAEWQIDH